MKFLMDKWITLFCFMVFPLKHGKLTSIMNDVHIKENELRPPTALNSTSNVNGTKDNQTLGKVFEPKFVVPTKHLVKHHSDTDHLQTVDYAIGSTTLNLTGTSKIDNTETLLGNTVADAFLMNSWDDTEIRCNFFFALTILSYPQVKQYLSNFNILHHFIMLIFEQPS